jgi:hypothetical protein
MSDAGDPVSGGSLLADRFLPRYDVTQVQHVLIEATPVATYAHLRNADLMDDALIRILVRLMAMPEQAVRRVRRLPTRVSAPAHATFDDMLGTNAWILLAEEPGRELVLGLLWPFTQAVPQIPSVQPEDWATFAEPGYAKVAWSLSVWPFGAGRTLLISEARTAATDPRTAARFRLLWRGLAPFAALLKRRLLHLVQAETASVRR